MATSPPHQPRYAIELALLAALATLWAGSYTFIKIGVETIPPITLIAARTLIAGSILALIMHLRGIRLPRDRETWRNFTIQACLNSVLPFTLVAWAETSIDAGLAVILNSMTPVFTFLITLAWSRHEATTLRKFIGVASGLREPASSSGVRPSPMWGRSCWRSSPWCWRPSATGERRFSAAPSRASTPWLRPPVPSCPARRS